MSLFAKELVLKQKQIDGRNRNISIGQIENRTEEIIMAVDQKTQYVRHAIPLKQREIKHIHHLAHHETGVMSAELRHFVGGRFRKDQSVESAVQDVAQGSGQNERQSEDNAGRRLFLFVAHHAANQPDEETDQSDAKQSERQFSPIESAGGRQVHSERGSVVLDEPQLEPIRKDDDRFVECHVGFDPDFQGLVGNEQDDDQQRYFLEIHFRAKVFRNKGTNKKWNAEEGDKGFGGQAVLRSEAQGVKKGTATSPI